MSEALENRAEILKLARLLGADAGELSFLQAVPASEVRAFREQLTDALFDGDRGLLGRLAAGSKLLPGNIAAVIAQKALGPLLCARIAGLTDAAKAVDTAKHLPPAFLADVSVELDPRRAAEVISRIPPALVADVAAELTNRGETVAMGRFVGFVPDAGVQAAMARIDDPSLLRIAFTMEGKERLGHMISLLGLDRLESVMLAAEREQQLAEALDLLEHLGTELKAAIAARAVEHGALLDGLVDVAASDDLWDVLLPIVALLPPAGKDTVAALAARLPAAALDGVLRTVATEDLWTVFVPLAADHLDPPGRERIAEAIAEVPDAIVNSLADAVQRERMWPALLRIAATMSTDQLSRIADRLLGAGLEDRLPDMIAAIEETGLWQPGLVLIAGLDGGLKQRIAPVAAALGAAHRARVVAKARELGLLDALGPVGAALAG
jgi:hypothetical protein